jgi:hypothetical protein
MTTELCWRNLETQSADVPAVLGATVNPVTNEAIMHANGWRRGPRLPPDPLPGRVRRAEWAPRFVQDPADPIAGIWQIDDKTEAEAATWFAEQAAAAEAADLSANRTRYAYENAFLLVCEVCYGTREKRGTADLLQAMHTKMAGAGDLAAFQALAAGMGVVFAIDAELKRYDSRWWDTVTWHDNPDIILAARRIAAGVVP